MHACALETLPHGLAIMESNAGQRKCNDHRSCCGRCRRSCQLRCIWLAVPHTRALQGKAVAAAVAAAVSKTQEEAAAAAAEAQEAACGEARAAALEEAAAMLVDVMYLGTVSTARTAQRAQRAQHSMHILCAHACWMREWTRVDACLPACSCHPTPPGCNSPPGPGCSHHACPARLQNFDSVTRVPYLTNVAYHERASAVAYAQHFGVQLSGEWAPCLPASPASAAGINSVLFLGEIGDSRRCRCIIAASSLHLET